MALALALLVCLPEKETKRIEELEQRLQQVEQRLQPGTQHPADPAANLSRSGQVASPYRMGSADDRPAHHWADEPHILPCSPMGTRHPGPAAESCSDPLPLRWAPLPPQSRSPPSRLGSA